MGSCCLSDAAWESESYAGGNRKRHGKSPCNQRQARGVTLYARNRAKDGMETGSQNPELRPTHPRPSPPRASSSAALSASACSRNIEVYPAPTSSTRAGLVNLTGEQGPHPAVLPFAVQLTESHHARYLPSAEWCLATRGLYTPHLLHVDTVVIF